MTTSVFFVCMFLLFWEGMKACQLPQDNCPPGATLTLSKPGGGAMYKCGDTIDKSEAREAPTVSYGNAQPVSIYIVATGLIWKTHRSLILFQPPLHFVLKESGVDQR